MIISEKVQDFVILNMLETLLIKHESYIRHFDILQDKVNTRSLKTLVILGRLIKHYFSVFKKVKSTTRHTQQGSWGLKKKGGSKAHASLP